MLCWRGEPFARAPIAILGGCENMGRVVAPCKRASRPLSCSRESLTLPAAFLVVKHYCGQKLVAAGSVEQALSNNMGGAWLLP